MASSSPMLASEQNDAPAWAAVGTAELDAVLGEWTHAVLNALNTITTASGLTQLLISRQKVTEAADPLARIESECMRAARLLRAGREFLAFPIRPAQAEVDLVAVLNACMASFPDRVQLTANRQLPAVTGDGEALRRAFLEIMKNAFQFGATRVSVGIKGLRIGHSRAIRIGFHDDGPGATAPVQRLVAPFFSTCPDEHNGLGLALAARIAVAHGGSLGMGADAAGCGTTFWVQLPGRA